MCVSDTHLWGHCALEVHVLSLCVYHCFDIGSQVTALLPSRSLLPSLPPSFPPGSPPQVAHFKLMLPDPQLGVGHVSPPAPNHQQQNCPEGREPVRSEEGAMEKEGGEGEGRKEAGWVGDRANSVTVQFTVWFMYM